MLLSLLQTLLRAALLLQADQADKIKDQNKEDSETYFLNIERKIMCQQPAFTTY
jgi:hypothetical protein